MYVFFPGNIYKHFMVNTEEIIMTHTEDTQLMTTHVSKTSYLVRKKSVIYIQRRFTNVSNKFDLENKKWR